VKLAAEDIGSVILHSDAERLIEEYIEYYNYERLQVKCGCTPYEWRIMPAGTA
jgi:hypothetical protein